MNDTCFIEKKVVVTGSSRGIGKAIALHFAQLGADVVVNFFRNSSPAEETAKEIRALGRQALVVKADIGSIEGINFLFDQIEQKFGGLDFLICNAASGYNRPALQQKPKGWDWTMNINARSLLFLAQRAVPLMEKRGGGAIVAISSPGSQRVIPDYVVVGASKAALEALVHYLAVELAPKKIVVNAVSPGVVLTDALSHFKSFQGIDEFMEKLIAQIPAGRLATPQDIAGVAAFLCSPAASMICGQVIGVDGGQCLPFPDIFPKLPFD